MGLPFGKLTELNVLPLERAILKGGICCALAFHEQHRVAMVKQITVDEIKENRLLFILFTNDIAFKIIHFI